MARTVKTFALLAAAALWFAAAPAPAGAADQTLVPAADDAWRGRFAEALAAALEGNWGRTAVVLQQAFSDGRNVLVEVPARLSSDAKKLLEDLKVLGRPPAARGEPEAADPFAPRRFHRREPAPGRRFLNAAVFARALFRVLGDDLKREYRSRYDRAAQELWDAFEKAPARALLRELALRYPFTEMGLRAQEALADLDLEAGHLWRALRRYRELELLVGEADRERVRGKAARAAARLGTRSGRAERAGKETLPVREGLFLGGRDSTESRWGGDLPVGSAPFLPGGTLTLSYKSSLWSSWVDLEARDEIRIIGGNRLEIHRAMGKGGAFPFIPLIHRERLWVSGVFHLYEFDARPGHGKLLRQLPKPSNEDLHRIFVERNDSALYTVTVWENRARAPGLPETIAITHYIADVVKPAQYMGYPITVLLPTRALVAYDTASGRVLWKTVPDRSRGAGPAQNEKEVRPQPPRRLPRDLPDDLQHLRRGLNEAMGPNEIPADISYSSPVLVRGQTVYAGGWRQEGNINAVVRALDLRTGTQLWETLVCGSTMEHTLFGELAREPFASFLVERGGVLFFVSSLGAVAALEAEDGTILWLHTYDTIPVESTLGRRPAMRTLVWGANPPLLLGHVLVTTPRDSSQLFAFDGGFGPEGAATAGEVLWRYDNSREDLRDLLGYLDGGLYFTGNAGVRVLDLRSLDARGRLAEGEEPEFRVGAVTWRRWAVPGIGALVRDGVVYCDYRNLWFVDKSLSKPPRPLLPEEGAVAAQSVLPGRVVVADNVILVISGRELAAWTPSEP